VRKPIFIRIVVRCWLAANVLTVLLAAPPKEAPAAGVLWNVAGPADWNTGVNWSPANVPTETDNAVFRIGGRATRRQIRSPSGLAPKDLRTESLLTMVLEGRMALYPRWPGAQMSARHIEVERRFFLPTVPQPTAFR
jgi:hypothetical protein